MMEEHFILSNHGNTTRTVSNKSRMQVGLLSVKNSVVPWREGLNRPESHAWV